jgi:hypothetical protein
MNSPAPLIVLRFRDIELPSGETIARHRRTIAENGYCWWGWLFRDYERNPHVELASLGASLAAGGDFPIALLDTGRGLVFRAVCRELRAAKIIRRTPSPAATPSYYNDRKAPAWFQFVEIEDADHSLVLGRTCAAMPSASDDCFIDLIGQPVNHIKDLRRQEVTLWVLG